MSKNKKKMMKKKAHEREARKRVLEKRTVMRKERKDEKIREEAFEKAFAEKQNLGLTTEEIKEKLENNMKILEALEQEFEKEEESRKSQTGDFLQKIQAEMDKFKQDIDAKVLQEKNKDTVDLNSEKVL